LQSDSNIAESNDAVKKQAEKSEIESKYAEGFAESSDADRIAESILAQDVSVLSPGLAKIRKRRWLLWFVLIIYLPTMWVTQKITHSFQDSLPVFFIWFVVLLAVTAFSAVAKCPRCKNYFHVNGMTLLYLRYCLHCQLHLTADKKARATQN
jgi:hypothetical protein